MMLLVETLYGTDQDTSLQARPPQPESSQTQSSHQGRLIQASRQRRLKLLQPNLQSPLKMSFLWTGLHTFLPQVKPLPQLSPQAQSSPLIHRSHPFHLMPALLQWP